MTIKAVRRARRLFAGFIVFCMIAAMEHYHQGKIRDLKEEIATLTALNQEKEALASFQAEQISRLHYRIERLQPCQ